MKKFLVKSIIYFFLLMLLLEVWVRVLHLHKDSPYRYVDEYQVEKWKPNQQGHSVTGNRRQNFSKYYINKSGYNSYREFIPTKDKVEVAIVGDSFIEGFHQQYYNSTGKKIENNLTDAEVYEYGYAGYDLADQLHLIYKYKDKFDLIDYVVLGLKFESDLTRGEYAVVKERMRLESPKYRLLKKSKLLVYTQSIGVVGSLKNLVSKLVSIIKPSDKKITIITEKEKNIYDKYLRNFESLITTYGFDKERFVFLLNSNETPKRFITYLQLNNYKFIDFSEAFDNSKLPTDLIYDKHWNNHGRTIVARLISDYINRTQVKSTGN